MKLNILRLVRLWALAALAVLAPVVAHAAPGVGDEIYGATVDKGKVEAEVIYGALGGGPADGEDALKIELAYAPTSRVRVTTQMKFEREPGDKRTARELGFEAQYALGRVAGIDVALYGEYAIGLNGERDAAEGKLLLQKRSGTFDARLNLIAEKSLAAGENVEFGYAASADVAVAGEVRAGVAAFGELGTVHRLFPRAEHYAGPIVKGEIEGLGPEIELQAGYLFPISKARDDTKGQFRLTLEVEM